MIAPGGAAGALMSQAAAVFGLAPAWGGAGASFRPSGGFAAPGAAWAAGGQQGNPTPAYNSIGAAGASFRSAGGPQNHVGAEQLLQGCPQPSELAATAAAVQALLVGGKRVEALRWVGLKPCSFFAGWVGGRGPMSADIAVGVPDDAGCEGIAFAF